MLNKKIVATFATATILTASLTTNTFADLDEKIINIPEIKIIQLQTMQPMSKKNLIKEQKNLF